MLILGLKNPFEARGRFIAWKLARNPWPFSSKTLIVMLEFA